MKTGHDRHVHHRFIEFSEVISKFPSHCFGTRCGLRCLRRMSATVEKDAATILQSWWKRAGKVDAKNKRNGMKDSWTTTLRDMMELKRLKHRLHTSQLIKQRKMNQKKKEKQKAIQDMQAMMVSTQSDAVSKCSCNYR